MAVELKIPEAGESISEVQIGTWLKNEGDYVEKDEPVVELETDKASMELPAPQAGRLSKIVKQSGETANVGDVIGRIEADGKAESEEEKEKAAGDTRAADRASEQEQEARTQEKAPPKQRERRTAPPSQPRAPASARGERRGQPEQRRETQREQKREPYVMPAARRILAEHKLDPSDVEGTGPGGRILKEDAARAVDESRAAPLPEDAEGAAPTDREPAAAREEETVPMSMLRRRIAERLVEAQRNAAILTTFNEIDMSAVLRLREQRQDEFEKQYGIKLGFMSFFVKASIDALRQFPQVNAEIRGTDIVYKNYYDIGVAVSTDRGLVVPVIRDAELLSFAEVEQKIADLARRARDKKLDVEELQGGTFTISNGGVFGSLLSTPILNPPQSAILGLHVIQERPVVREGQVVIRPMMYVALSYDHRIIDGRESVTFLKRIKACIEDPVRMLIEA